MEPSSVPEAEPARRSTPRRGAALSRAVSRGGRRVAASVEAMFSAGGPGFRRLAQSHAASVAGDTLVTMALAGTLFFQVPSAEARGNVALYLLLTAAPFAVIAPALTLIYARYPTAYRRGLIASTAVRSMLVVGMLIAGVDTLWLFPLAFVLLMSSRLHGISRGALLPVAIDKPIELVAANALLARIGILTSAVVAVPGAGLVALSWWPALVAAGVSFGLGTMWGLRVPRVVTASEDRPRPGMRPVIPRAIRLARLATAGVRFLNGFLLLLVAFAFRDVDAGVADFGALLVAGGFGFFLASLVSPWLERRLREEPMVVGALAIEAAAAFIAAQVFGLPAAAALAAAAGLAWGTAKFGFDGLLQATVPPETRGYAFTLSETSFQLAWVVGALVPVTTDLPTGFGLATAGVVALAMQLVYVSGLLVPLAEARRRQKEEQPPPPARKVTELL